MTKQQETEPLEQQPDLPHLDLPPLAESPSTLSLPPIVSQPAIIESRVFFMKLQNERRAAELELLKIDGQISALQRRRDDLNRIIECCDLVLEQESHND